jgi:hypothetical protein
LILGTLFKAIREGIEEGKIERGSKGDEGEEQETSLRRERKSRAKKTEETSEKKAVETEIER